MNVVVNHQHAEKFNRLLKYTNPDADINLISTNSINPGTAIELKQKLAEGESVVLLADRVSEGSLGRVLPVDFLGEKTALPEGVFRLAARLECPVYFMTCINNKSGFTMLFKQLAETCSDGSRTEIINKLVANYLQALTDACIEAPLQWFNFYDYWAEGSAYNDEITSRRNSAKQRRIKH
jgi:predicted LPLAT superfamily acyltransferase